MGLLVNGEWTDQWYDTSSHGGKFVRPPTQFRSTIPSAQFPAESGRYHLYVSLACPWAHRTLIARALKGLKQHISVTVVHPHMLENGWEFDPEDPDPVFGARYLYEVYRSVDPSYTGRVTVPVLFDLHTKTIVCNESSEILRILNSGFDSLLQSGSPVDLYPAALRAEIDEANAFVYPNVNDGVYRVGFATTQTAYAEAFERLFAALEELEGRLEKSAYLVGDTLTEADIRLFTTLIRFDAVYVGHFKCNRKRVADFPALRRYVVRIYRLPGVRATVDFDHIKRHYYYSHANINPTRVVPIGPDLDYLNDSDEEEKTV